MKSLIADRAFCLYLPNLEGRPLPPCTIPVGSHCCVLQALRDREVCVYVISCKSQHNVNITLEWLTKHAKS